MSVFEAIMLLCFGAAWPFSIWKSYKSRSNQGKSLLFMAIVEVGYGSGIIHKVLYSHDLVLGLYVLNFALVLTDLMLYWRNARTARKSLGVVA